MTERGSMIINVAAELAVLGVDPTQYLFSNDPFIVNLMVALRDRVYDKQQIRDKNLAIEIAKVLNR